MKLLTMMLFAVGTAACTANPPVTTQSSSANVSDDDESDGEESSSLTADAMDPSADAITPLLRNCSIVQFCNAPGADGTRCLQQDCGDGIGIAVAECRIETTTVCGSPTCPFIFVDLFGNRHTLACQ